MRKYIYILKSAVAVFALLIAVSCNKGGGSTESNDVYDIIDTKQQSEVNTTDYSFCILSPSLNGGFAAEVATRFKGGVADSQNADILFVGQEELCYDNVWEAYENGKTIAVALPNIEILNGVFKERGIELMPNDISETLAIVAFNKAGNLFTSNHTQTDSEFGVAVNSLAKWTTYVRPHSFTNATDINSLLQATHLYDCWNLSINNELVIKNDNKFEYKMSGNALFEQFYSVIPLHSFDNNKGDFYLIDATFSIASKNMYHGITHIRPTNKTNYYASAFFLKGFSVKIELIDSKGSAVATKFYNVPQPVTMSGSTSYSSGIKWSADATLSGGLSGGNLTLSGGVSYNSVKSHTVRDVMIASAAQNGKVDYTVDIKNLPKESTAEPPLVARNTLDFHCGWVWYVESANNNDETTSYRIKVTVEKLNYASKGSVEKNGMKNEHLFSKNVQFNLPRPNRVPGGFVKLYNSISDSYMTNISFINAQDSTKIYKDESGSVYTKGEFYEACLPAGEYNLEFYIGETKHTSADIGTFTVVRAETLTLQSGVYK